MVHTSVAAAAASASSRSGPSMSRPSMRIRPRSSFHAGAPIPDLSSSYEYDRLSSHRRSGGRSGGGFGAGSARRESIPTYHTFPDPPPAPPRSTRKSRGSRGGSISPHNTSPASTDTADFTPPSPHHDDDDDDGRDQSHEETPLPWKQLSLMALLSVAEQTALNSISPYLPAMVASFDEIPDGEEGLYVGLLASGFALAQLTTNLLWGYLSDTVGRKPVMLLGTSLLAACFAFFGFARSFAQLLAVHAAMGLLNGNAAVVPTCLGELTDRSNQSRAFIWLPVMYSLGGITGPALGGLLVGSTSSSAYPFVAPNIVSAALLLASVIVLAIWFDETLDDADAKANRAGLGWVEKLFDFRGLRWLGRDRRRGKGRIGSWTARWPTSGSRSNGSVRGTGPDDSDDSNDGEDEDDEPTLRQGLLDSPSPHSNDTQSKDTAHSDAEDGKPTSPPPKSVFRELANRTTLAVLITYLFFQLSNISYNSLYPIFASAAPPTGRDLSPGTIGLSISLAGVATILFQVFAFQPLKARMGNLGTYRASLLGIAISMALMPWVCYADGRQQRQRGDGFVLGSGKAWLYSELGVVLIIKNICAVGGLSSVMLLITNSAPSHETLGTLNGVAQTLSAAGRSVGPFISGALFTLSTRVRPKGEALGWGIFAGIALLGWLGTYLIRGADLESGDWIGDDDDDDDDDDDGDEEEAEQGRERARDPPNSGGEV
ncbi:hypothetical protein VTK73DRAFT_635 [Phialemonium thermophilum]|uniref:Major facilitator superfamily (MFS) profile domain-containing protein n=1 Tax=Phialemonium thermophilum TaxID=223376 RepID=A0ABR3XDG9_9PEZI